MSKYILDWTIHGQIFEVHSDAAFPAVRKSPAIAAKSNLNELLGYLFEF